MTKLGDANAAKIKSNAPTYTPIIPNKTSSSTTNPSYNPTSGMTVVNNITGMNMTNPNAISEAVTQSIKYGTAVTVPASFANMGGW
jgi:hypothetical protein